MTAREAMAYGRPVVTTRVGGLLDVVEDGVSGLTVESGSDVALRRAVTLLLDDGDLRARIGGAARQKARETLSFEAQAHNLAAVYRDAAAADRGEA
jgi:type III pantothenate kinase